MLVSWPSNHGAVFAAAGLFLGGGLRHVHIASSEASLSRASYGIHPDVNSLRSSGATRFASLGTDFTGLATIGRMAGDSLFREHARGGWVQKRAAPTIETACSACGRCANCVLGPTAYWGQLENCRTPAGPLPWHNLDTAGEPRHRWFIWEDPLAGCAQDAERRSERETVMKLDQAIGDHPALAVVPRRRHSRRRRSLRSNTARAMHSCQRWPSRARL